MTGVRLAVGIADAIPRSAPEPAAEPAATEAAELATMTPGPSPAPAPRGGLRGRLARWLRRPAEYARAYLTATLTHQLHLQALRLAATEAAATHVAQRAPLFDEMMTELRGLSLRLEEVERRQARAAAEVLGAVSPRFDAAEARAQGLRDQIGALGPRFDELDIKVRPLIAFDAESTAVRTADGYVLLPIDEPLFTVMVANASSGGLEPGVRRVLQALATPKGAAADVGANVGLLTLALASTVGPAGRVFAFEPEARVRAQLLKTLHLNGLAQVTLSAAAVGREAGRLAFNQSPVIGHSSLYALPPDEQAQARVAEVEVVRLDDAIPAGLKLDVVKIDVEGAELDVLAGMARVIADSPDLAILAEFGPSHLARVEIAPEAWFAAFGAHGLAAHLIEEPSGRVVPTDAAALAGVESANLVFLRPGGAATARVGA